MPERPTHRLVREPRMSGRYLADYMAAGERKRRSILRDAKYRGTARIVQHERARRAVADFLLRGGSDTDALRAEAQRLRDMMADDDFGRQVLDYNADYIDCYVEKHDPSQLPAAEPLAWPDDYRVSIGGVSVNPEVRFMLRKVTRQNKVKTGFATLRYAKDTSLGAEVAAWQSSLLFGCRKQASEDTEDEADKALCITICAFSGKVYPAPGDAVSRFADMEAACRTIADQWPKIQPPAKATL